jgi:hypothetical protein
MTVEAVQDEMNVVCNHILHNICELCTHEDSKHCDDCKYMIIMNANCLSEDHSAL